MDTWDDYKKEVRETDPAAAADMDVSVGFTKVMGAIIMKRQELGLSVEELAEKSGISVSTIARIENGSVTPNIGTVIRILKAMGLMLTTMPWEE